LPQLSTIRGSASACNPIPKVLVRNFTVAPAADIKEHVTVLDFNEVAFSINDINRYIERFEKSFVISALAFVRHG
jgi:hypothetical protein